MKSLRFQDSKAEKALADFMDENLYSRFPSSVRYERITDKNLQLQGIDIKFTQNGQTFNVDEKATLHYCNSMIPTFAFEIDSVQNSILREGWFINSQIATEYYMLIWPNVKCFKNKDGQKIMPSEAQLTKDSFTIVEAMLLNRFILQEYLNKIGLSKEVLQKAAVKIRQERIGSTKDEKIEIAPLKNCYYFFTGHLEENPINLIIKREVLFSISDSVYFVSSDGYARIK